MKTKKAVSFFFVLVLLIVIGTNVASAYQSYSGSIKYVNTNYYYLLTSQEYSSAIKPAKSRNLVTYYEGNHTANWLVRAYRNNVRYQVSSAWHKAGDYTYNYNKITYYKKVQLVARANSNEGSSAKRLSGRFWAEK